MKAPSAIIDERPYAESQVTNDWRLHEFGEVGSTNLVAANFPAWSAIRAEQQTAGRGRFSRSWVSDKGGLWLSAVVPRLPGSTHNLLPLAAGLVLCRCLQILGASGFRLRWPNDVLIGHRKLAGLLIDHFVPELAVVGIGVNVFNSPERIEPDLRNCSIALKECMPKPPELKDLAATILAALSQVLQELQTQAGAASCVSAINALWQAPSRVELDLDGRLCRGTFSGVDASGRLLLVDEHGAKQEFAPHEVRHLTEL